MLQVPPA